MITVEKLIELGALRKAMFSTNDEWYVLYTENGPIDITLSKLTD